MSLFWEWMYLFKKTPWDTGITPPEIVAMLESGKVPIGRALDLGCGTGTNAITLAQRGFEVTAIDISRRAISLAKRKARSAQLTDRIRFERGDVTLLRRWVTRPFDRFCLRHRLLSQSRCRGAPALCGGFDGGAQARRVLHAVRVRAAGRSAGRGAGRNRRAVRSGLSTGRPASAAATAAGADRHGIL